VEALTVPAFLEFRAVDDDDISLAALQASLLPGVLLDWDRYLGRDGTASASFLRCASYESLADFITVARWKRVATTRPVRASRSARIVAKIFSRRVTGHLLRKPR